MRGIDTNVLVRYLTADDAVQFEAVAALIEGAEDSEERLFVNVVVLCELCWVLRGRRYGYDRTAIAEVIERILAARTFEVERRDLVRRALQGYRRGEADFADCLIGAVNRTEGCVDTVSLDGGLERGLSRA